MLQDARAPASGDRWRCTSARRTPLRHVCIGCSDQLLSGAYYRLRRGHATPRRGDTSRRGRRRETPTPNPLGLGIRLQSRPASIPDVISSSRRLCVVHVLTWTAEPPDPRSDRRRCLPSPTRDDSCLAVSTVSDSSMHSRPHRSPHSLPMKSFIQWSHTHLIL